MTPFDLEVVSLRQIISRLEPGVSLEGLDRPAAPGERGVLKISAVTTGQFLPGENKSLEGKRITRFGPTPAAGDLIISRANTADLVGAAAIVDESAPHLTLPDKLWRLQLADPKRDSSRWLYHVLSSRGVRQALRSRATGTGAGMKNISQNSFLGIVVRRPERKMQDEIASVLDAIQRAVVVAGSLLDEMHQLKGGLMQRLLTGQCRFSEFMSFEWRDVGLGEVFRERRESGRADLPLLSITNARGVVARDDVARRDSSSEDKAAYKRIAPGDVGYNTMRMWQGVSGRSRNEGIVSPAYTVIVPQRGRILSEYAVHLFKTPSMIDKFRRFSQGLVDDTLSLKYPAFARIRVLLPGVEEQARVAQVLDALDQEIDCLRRLQDAFVSQRASLMNRLLNSAAHR